MTDEIFGPILPVVTVQSLDDAIVSSTRGPSRWRPTCSPRRKSIRERVIKEVPAGGMLVNHLALPRRRRPSCRSAASAPSGMGAYHGKFGFEEFSHRKSVLTKPTRPDLSSFIYPPVYRDGLEAGSPAVLGTVPRHRLLDTTSSREEPHARSAGSRHRRHRSRWRTGP